MADSSFFTDGGSGSGTFQTIEAKIAEAEAAKVAAQAAQAAAEQAEADAQLAESQAEAAKDAAELAQAGATGSETNSASSATTAGNHAADAQKLAVNPEDSQYTLSDGSTTGYSALHYNEKASDSAAAASASASTASGHVTTASGHAATASGHAATANTKAGEAAVSAGNAATSESNAAASASAAASSAASITPTAIENNSGTPVLASGITDAEVRTLIGAGTSSFDGAYGSLTGTPTIPTNNNQLTNGAGYITSVPAQSFASLTGKPTTISGYGITDAFDGAFSSLSGKPTTISGYGITDAFDGAYSSLTGTPTIPTNNNQLTNGAGYITASVTGDLTVDTDTLHVDSTNNRVGIGTTAPDRLLTLQGDNSYMWIKDAGGGNTAFIGSDGTNDGWLRLYDSSHTIKVEIESDGVTYFNGGNVGIGDTAPVTPLTIATTNKLGSTFTGTTNGEGLTVTQTNYTSGNYVSLVEAAYDDSGDASPNVRIGAKFDSNGSSLAFGTSNSYGSGITNTAMLIGNTGNVDISGNLTVGDSTNKGRTSPSTTGHLVIDGNGYDGAITLDGTGMHIYHNSSIRDIIFGINSNEYFRMKGGGTANGKFGINNSSPSYTVDGSIGTTASAATHFRFRIGSDSYGGGLWAKQYYGFSAIGRTGGNAEGIRFENNAVSPADLDIANGFGRDNAMDLGTSSNRWDDVRATNGTIQTSDQNLKQNIAVLTDAEITAAKAISGLFKTFKWIDKVEAKGDDARTHTGVIAQEVQQAMTDNGLDATKYAFWCSDTWWEAEQTATTPDEEEITGTVTFNSEEEAPEGATQVTRLSIRYPELLAFIGAATEQRLTNIETRLTALEAE